MKIDVKNPTYTQVPNAILDNMAEFTDAEFRFIMAVCRQTFGWWVNGIQRESHKMSISFLMKATGMSNQGVINAYHRLSEKGVVFREVDGDSFRYGLVVSDVDGQSTALTPPVNGVDRQLVNGVDTKKKRVKEKEIKDVASFPKSNPNPKPPTVPKTPLKDELFIYLIPEPLKARNDFMDAWADWCNHRKEKRKNLTESTVKYQMKSFSEIGCARAVAAIKHSITNGWTGVFEPKQSSYQQKQSFAPNYLPPSK